MKIKFHVYPAKLFHPEAGVNGSGERTERARSVAVANLSAMIKAEARIQKNAKMKGDPEELLKAKGCKVTKSVMADGSLKTNNLSYFPMSY
jgi:hypothetical protein